jgi:hypothetical protein
MILMQASGVDTRYFQGNRASLLIRNELDRRSFLKSQMWDRVRLKAVQIDIERPNSFSYFDRYFQLHEVSGLVGRIFEVEIYVSSEVARGKVFSGSPHKTVHWVYDAV